MAQDFYELSLQELAAKVSKAEGLIQKGQMQVERTRRRIQETQLVIGFHRSIHGKRESIETND
jgi:hypothetical protein